MRSSVEKYDILGWIMSVWVFRNTPKVLKIIHLLHKFSLNCQIQPLWLLWPSMCFINKFCTAIFQSLIIIKTLTKFLLFVWLVDKSIKSDRKGKLSVFSYILTIVSYSINTNHPTSECFHIKEFSEIRTIMSQIFWHLYEYVTNIFNMCVSVSVDTKLYTCKIRAYDIEYIFNACILARDGSVLVVY